MIDFPNSEARFEFTLTVRDFDRLEAMLATPAVSEVTRAMLRAKIGASQVMFGSDIPAEVVTIGSRVRVSLTGRDSVELVVGDDERAVPPPGVSQLALSAPLAIALLGCKVGQTALSPREDGFVETVEVLAVLAQPEASVRTGDVVAFRPRRPAPAQDDGPDDPGPSAA